MSIADFALGTKARPTQIAGDTAFVICAKKTAGRLRMLVEELDEFLDMAGNDRWMTKGSVLGTMSLLG